MLRSRIRSLWVLLVVPLGLSLGCGGSGSQGTPMTASVVSGASSPTATSTASPTSSATVPTGAPTTSANAALVVPSGFTIGVIARVPAARGLAMLPNGDLLVGTGNASVSIVPAADAAGEPGAVRTFATFPEGPAYGVAYGSGHVYVGTNTTVWSIPYTAGDLAARATNAIARVRQGQVAPHSDGDVHRSTSVAVAGSRLFVSVGSSCNACVEVDPTRATIQTMALDGSGMTTYATRIRNAIALAVDPATGTVWAGGAGQDALPSLHPYEYVDALTTHAPVADYGWPACEENRDAFGSGADCSRTVVPLLEFPAYSTLTGAAFYPATQTGRYAFPAAYRGLYVAAHGSWHTPSAAPYNGHHVPPRVAFVPMSGAVPAKPVTWSDPTTQWSDFVSGFQNDAAGDTRVGTPDGIAIGPSGSLFVADDAAGVVYRIRPR